MQLTCPRCAERFDLESAVEDESGRALMALLGRVGIGRELIAYLGLFRPRTQALRWSRALALAMDIEHLAQQHGETVTAAALRETVEAMRPKLGPAWKPLKNHNYLHRVLESVAARDIAAPVIAPQTPRKPQTKTAQAMTALMEDDHG